LRILSHVIKAVSSHVASLLRALLNSLSITLVHRCGFYGILALIFKEILSGSLGKLDRVVAGMAFLFLISLGRFFGPALSLVVVAKSRAEWDGGGVRGVGVTAILLSLS
jgi:hypothetical protein